MSDSASNNGRWKICFQELPSREVIFFSQVTILYVIIITSLVHISLRIGNQTLWSSLLSGALGYLLPSPYISKKRNNNESFLPDTT